MIRIHAIGLALFVAGSGAPMAQHAQNPVAAPPSLSPASSPAKVEARLPPRGLAQQRVASREMTGVVQTGSLPANAMLDADGRIVPLPAQRFEQDRERPCNRDQKPRPGTIRAMAEKEAEARGLPRDTLNAVLRAEGLLGPSSSRGNEQRMALSVNAGAQDCAALHAAIQRSISMLNMLRQRYPHPLHHLAAYRDGEETFLKSGGVPESVETLRFVATALNELAGFSVELAALPQNARTLSTSSSPVAEDTAAMMRASNRERSPATPDPRWVQGFVFNLE